MLDSHTVENVKKLYIIVNDDLHLTKGRASAQVSHITELMISAIVSSSYEDFPIPQSCIDYKIWKMNPVTVILKASTLELMDIIKTISVSYHFILTILE